MPAAPAGEGNKRLCMILHGWFPPDARVARAIRAAVGSGYEVDLVCLRRPNSTAPSTEVVFGARVIRLPVVHDGAAGFGTVVREYVGFTVLATLAVARLAYRRRYSVIQVHNPPDFLVVGALLPKLLFGAHVVLDVHDLAPDMFAMRFGERRGARLADRFLRLVERGAAGVADAVITVHEPYRRQLEARGVPASKLTVVMNSVDEAVLPAVKTPHREPAFRIVYHGTLAPHYGVELLVDAVAKIAPEIENLRVEIIGIGDSLPAARAHAERLGLRDIVNFPGGGLQHDVLAKVQGASVGVVPNLPTRLNRYALSSKLFEYVALGIPAVVADLPTLRAHFSDAEVLFFRAGDASALADALLQVARDPAAAEARAAAALRRCEDYSWSLNRARYVELLDRLSGRNGAQPDG